jgi:arginine deiminase
MKKDIRKPEVELYEFVYKTLFDSEVSFHLPSKETFEGGDAYIHDKTIYIGVGSRTTIGAAIAIYENLKDEIQERKYSFALVIDEDATNRSFVDQMNFMHLDTFSNPVGHRQIAVCLNEAKLRKIKLLKTVGSKTTIIETNKSFLDYLFEDGQEIISIPEEEQQTFGCNFLAINNTDILVPLKTNKKTIEGLEEVGKKIHYVHLDESTKGFGAAHCMTGQLLRA